VVAERALAGLLADRARVLGLAIDDLHTVIWMSPDRSAGADPNWRTDDGYSTPSPCRRTRPGIGPLRD
jgi:hypothetical protein